VRRRLRAIPSSQSRVDRDCVETLAKVYRAALRGEFQAVAIATVTEGASGGCFGSAWSAPEQLSQMSGAINYFNHRFLHEAIYED
jgi:hypothetical protein